MAASSFGRENMRRRISVSSSSGPPIDWINQYKTQAKFTFTISTHTNDNVSARESKIDEFAPRKLVWDDMDVGVSMRFQILMSELLEKVYNLWRDTLMTKLRFIHVNFTIPGLFGQDEQHAMLVTVNPSRATFENFNSQLDILFTTTQFDKNETLKTSRGQWTDPMTLYSHPYVYLVVGLRKSVEEVIIRAWHRRQLAHRILMEHTTIPSAVLSSVLTPYVSYVRRGQPLAPSFFPLTQRRHHHSPASSF